MTMAHEFKEFVEKKLNSMNWFYGDSEIAWRYWQYIVSDHFEVISQDDISITFSDMSKAYCNGISVWVNIL